MPIPVAERIGKSHIKPVRDGIRFLYSPLKLFAPTAGAFFVTALGYYAWTYFTEHRLTNMSMLLFSASVIIFLIGLISEQITGLTYLSTRAERKPE